MILAALAAYLVIATLVQMMGEDAAFAYLEALHKSVSAYPKAGPGPVKAVARGEAAVSVGLLHAGPREALAGFPVKTVVPCNPEAAKTFVDWALTPAAQRLAAEVRQFMAAERQRLIARWNREVGSQPK
jgi:iron(III) transport system substrate-binding protein